MTGPTTTSERVDLARRVLDAVLSHPAVVEADSGPHNIRMTAAPEGPLPGIIVAAESEGRYSISLGLRVEMTELSPLAEALRGRIERAARAGGLVDRLGSVDLIFTDVVLAASAGPDPR
jgi:hypothetical protein